ncbi:hypothetical protein JXA31_06020 [Candidatus Bathyarchaeota archaeon]|nr:hypothetical protein [Candidatus Bathyarchaeota archaeon]
MVERTVGLEIEKAYADLKAVLLEKNCRIIEEEAPTFISVRQGSLWGISPLTAKKNVNYRFDAVDSGTRITCSSSLASDWKNLTIIGSALAVVVVALCLWMSMDLDALVATQQPSYWSWIATVDGYIDFQTAQMFAGLTRMLAVFLAIILVAEVVIVVYVHFRINSFAEETLNALRQSLN